LFKSLSIKLVISISSESTSSEKSSAAKVKPEETKQKQITLLISNSTSLKLAHKICKGWHKAFVFICSTIAPELLEDISGMSDGCPLALWTAINNCYGNNDVALQAARRDLGRPNVHLVCPGDTVRSIWAHIQALVGVLAAETGGHKMSERSRLIILATALKSINPAFDAQFNALVDDSLVEAVLKAFNRVEASRHASPNSNAILYTGQHQHQCSHFTGQHQHGQQRQQPQQPTSAYGQGHGQAHGQVHRQSHRHGNWGEGHSRYCSLHDSHGHLLDECCENACLRPSQASPCATTLATMTAAAVAAASAMPAHALQSAIFAAMTAAAAAARLSDFAIISEPDAHGAAAVVAPAVAPISINKSHANYSVFSLVPTISLPTIADTGATQHTTNRHDLLHNFIPLAVPSCLVCANSGHIKCVGHSTLRSTTIVNGQQSGIVMCNVAYVPNASHTLILLQQLLDARCHIVFNQLHRFQFFLDDQLRLLSYRSGNLFYFNITFFAAALSVSLTAALSAFSSPLCINLIHHRLGHASEERCHEFVRQSADFNDQEKHKILSSSLTPLCRVCLTGKQTVCGISRQPHTNHAPPWQPPW
jgi:hypothetical protein